MNTWSSTAERHLAAQGRGVLSNFQVTECNMTWKRIAHFSNSPNAVERLSAMVAADRQLCGRSRGTRTPESVRSTLAITFGRKARGERIAVDRLAWIRIAVRLPKLA